MRISLIKSKKDEKSYKIFKGFGFNIIELEDLEEVDKNISNLINQDYDTIILTNEIAGFSQDIVKRYRNDKDINIIITRDKIK